MRIHRGTVLVSMLVLAAGLALTMACSKKATNPGGGGGGGGGAELSSPDLGSSAAYPHTFMTTGTFPYHCRFHGVMTGSVMVDNSAAAPKAVSIVDFSFSPANITVGKGSTVTWTNNGSATHSVTSN